MSDFSGSGSPWDRTSQSLKSLPTRMKSQSASSLQWDPEPQSPHLQNGISGTSSLHLLGLLGHGDVNRSAPGGCGIPRWGGRGGAGSPGDSLEPEVASTG